MITPHSLFRTLPRRNVLSRLFTSQGLGLVIILFSATGFGAVTPFARLAYDAGVNVTTLMAARYALAGLVVMGYLARRRQAWRLSGRRLWLVLGLALILGLMSFSYLESIRFIPVSLAALIYYTYPILVSLLAFATRERRWVNRQRKVYALVFGGQLLSLVGLVGLLGLSGQVLNFKGLLMAAFSALSFTLVMASGSRLMRAVPPMVLNLYVALVNTALFAALSLSSGGFAWPIAPSGWTGLLASAVFFTIGFLGLFLGVVLIGPSRAACLSNLEPLVTIVLATIMLDEPFSIWQIIGAGGVLFGIYTMCRQITEGQAQ